MMRFMFWWIASSRAPAKEDACMSHHWETLRNPILAYPDWSIKDVSVARSGSGTWLLFFSAFCEDRGRIRSHVVGVKSDDLREFSRPFLHLDGQAEGWIGFCSPDVSRYGDGYCLTFNSWGDKEGWPNQLFYLLSEDGETWTGPPRPLAQNLTKGIRAIDAALGVEKNEIRLLYKEVQTTRLARAASLEGAFEFLCSGRPTLRTGDGDTAACENYQFLFSPEEHSHRLLATRMDAGHRPYLFTVSATDPLRYENGYELRVAPEAFNSVHRANSACLTDCRREDGFWYLFYAGNTERETFAGRGHNRLGVARSTNGTDWAIAGVAV